jgi:sugar lactone lactonase YvrE
VTALQPRTWAEGDRVARVDRRAPNWHWRLGTVCALDGPHWVVVRWNDETPLESYVSCVGADDRNLIREDEVPVDERWWLPPQTRDQLVRQEAAGRLKALADALPARQVARRCRIADVADAFDDLLLDDLGESADAARALLTPAPTPARTP